MRGEELEQRLEKLIAFRKYLQIVERRGPSRDVVHGAARARARDKAFFADRERVEALATALTTPTRTVTVQQDEEHQAFALAIEDRIGGYPRHHRIDQDFVTTGEFRTLASSYQDVKDIRGPMIVKTAASVEADEAAEAAADAAAADETAHRRRAARRGDQARRRTQAAASAIVGAPQARGAHGSRARRRGARRVARRARRVLHRRRQEGRRDQPLQGSRRDEPRHAVGRPR